MNKKVSQYVRELNDAIAAYISDTEPIHNSIIKVRQTHREIYQEEEIKTLILQKNEIQKSCIELIDKAFNDYLARLEKVYVLDGKNIDEADIRLLESDLFEVSQKDINLLSEKYHRNYTMMTALKRVADKKHLSISFHSKAEKIKAATQVRENAKSYILNDNGCGVSDYCKTMSGYLFGNYDYLDE